MTRLKGIETPPEFLSNATVMDLQHMTRLKGIETTSLKSVFLLARSHLQHMTRLKGIETTGSLNEERSIPEFTTYDPIEGD